MLHLGRVVSLSVPLLVGLLVLSGCGSHSDADPAQADSTVAPDTGACRMLTAHDVAQPDNATRTVDCTASHTAQTYLVGALPGRFDHASYDDPALAAYTYRRCSQGFVRFTGADQSLAMRTIVSWAWFRPSTAAWGKGARWFRCDVIGGGTQTHGYVVLPTTAKDLLAGKPADRWLVCAQGRTVAGSVKVPCNRRHDWRAVTTIVLGKAGDDYPGDAAVQRRTRDFCSKSVGAWLGYPADYDFGYSWFHRSEWQAGNRRSVCWARTSR